MEMNGNQWKGWCKSVESSGNPMEILWKSMEINGKGVARVLQVLEVLWKSYGNQWKSMERVLQGCCKSWQSYGTPIDINVNGVTLGCQVVAILCYSSDILLQSM